MTPVALLAADPRLGGMVVRGDGDAVLSRLEETGPVVRCSVAVDLDRLVGGLDLAATLASGRPARQPGLLDRCHGGTLVVAFADRLEADVAGAIASALDAGNMRLVLLGSEASVLPPSLLERIAFWDDQFDAPGTAPGRDVLAMPALLALVAEAAAALGVTSMRAALFALRTAQALANGPVDVGHVAEAVRMVLVPRASQWPDAPEDVTTQDQVQPQAGGMGDASGPLVDTVLDAVAATLPPGLLDVIRTSSQRSRRRSRGAGAMRRAPIRGRPVGVRAGLPRNGARLALLETLNAAAPWQKIRAAEGRIAIRKADLRIRRFMARAGTTTIFAVDASGSAAVARMAEAKGAVELLLTQAYVKRAQVALIAFRGERAETIVPPTRSLTRARNLLADLPGGGGTPVAAGLDAAHVLALAERARSRDPQIVVLTDGRANMPADGTAQAGAERAARDIARDGLAVTLIDISARPRSEGRALAAAMAARYVALPRGHAADVGRAIQ